MKKIPVLLDVDAGVDDTLAIIFALLSPLLDVKAITTVSGNVEVQQCTRNVLLTLQQLESVISKLPVVGEGKKNPLQRKLFTAKEVHEKDGIGGATRFYSLKNNHPKIFDAEKIIVKTITSTPNITIIATGPLTNIASIITKHQQVKKNIKEIVIMGGAFDGVHNTGPVAEFNFYVDPEAADIVLNSGIPIRLIPLNVTEECVFSPNDIQKIHNLSLKKYIERVTKFYFQFHQRTENFLGGYLHDVLAVVAVTTPSLFKIKKGYVCVESNGKYARGLSIFFPQLNTKKEAELPEWVKKKLQKKPNVQVAHSVNAKKFKKIFLETLSKK